MTITPVPTTSRDVDVLPEPAGPFSAHVRDRLLGGRGLDDHLLVTPIAGGLDDRDFQLALWMLQVSAAERFADVDPVNVQSLSTTNLRWSLQRDFEAMLRSEVTVGRVDDLSSYLAGLCSDATEVDQTEAQTRALFLAKAPYLAFEADPHTLALARLPRDLQPLVAEIQAGEYGVGHRSTHAQIYRACLAELGVEPMDAVASAPAAGLALANSAWLFGSSMTGAVAALGQLCILEIDSVEPCRRQVTAWNRAGMPEAARRWYDVHVLADREHGDIVENRLLPAISDHHPGLVADVAFGAAITQRLFDRIAAEVGV